MGQRETEPRLSWGVEGRVGLGVGIGGGAAAHPTDASLSSTPARALPWGEAGGGTQ